VSDEDKKVLEENGWNLDCESPFEISHEATNSFASNGAADIVLRYLKDKLVESNDPPNDDFE